MRKAIVNWYERYERHISSLALLGGFVFDALYLKRIDLFWENIWVLAHLIVAAVGILLLNYYFRRSGNPEEEYKVYSVQFWLIFIIQFAFGGLLSTFLVFYFRSGTLGSSWPFILLLVLAFVGNEAFKKHYARLYYQVSILFLSIFSFAIFIVPVIIHGMGDRIFVYSGFLSLAFIYMFVSILRLISYKHVIGNIKTLRLSVLSIYLLINFLYFANLIPPIPLSLKEAGVYHSIARNSSGNFDALDEAPDWRNFFKQYKPIHVILGRPVYVYSAIFSPASLNVNLTHEWQRYDEHDKSWITIERIALPIIGGRDGGYRTYSYMSGVSDGFWRVNVLTPQGLPVGRIEFEAKTTKVLPALTNHEI
ncbi:MAG: DUF2914 domain-containing protein [Candidatus Vogelbacteria bacterium]|nr:DUF2914 domain-containing protein [Candidatus Vogelbacteria bacterium]